AANKMDLPEAKAKWPTLKRRIEKDFGAKVWPVSAVSGEGVPELLNEISARLDALREDQPEAEEEIRIYRLPSEDTTFSVERQRDGFKVTGRLVERTIAMADMDSEEGIADLQRQLDRLGILKALERAGVKNGDTVRIADFEMEW